MNRLQRRRKFPLIGVLILLPGMSYAYEFWPSDVEWQNWPGYCKAKYAWTNIGKSSKFANQVLPEHKAELSVWEAAGVAGVHHFCAGTIYLQRARLERDETRRNYLLRDAKAETQFTFERSDHSNPRFVYVAMQMATIMYEQGESTESLAILDALIRSQPTVGIAYSAAAVFYRKSGNLDRAKDILLQGYQATDGQSAELNYNLGLILLEMGDVDEAEKYADEAYALGYPLPGLRTKLAKLGRK